MNVGKSWEGHGREWKLAVNRLCTYTRLSENKLKRRNAKGELSENKCCGYLDFVGKDMKLEVGIWERIWEELEGKGRINMIIFHCIYVLNLQNMFSK